MKGPDAVAEAVTLIRSQLSCDVRIREIAARTYTDTHHLCRIFKRKTGLTPASYLMAARIERAVELLLHTDLPVTQICYEVGYNSLGTFITRFKHWVGLSPGQFRAHMRRRKEAAWGEVESGCPHAGATGGTVSGIVRGPAHAVPIYLGLFATPFPRRHPVRCAIVPRSGPFALTGIPPGRYYLLAAAKSGAAAAGDLTGADHVAAGHPTPLLIGIGTHVKGVHLTLRARQVTDPPILGVYLE